MIEAFDGANPDESCPVRFATTQPTQALELLNGEFSQTQARALAARVRQEVGNEPGNQVQQALWLVTQRIPTGEEIDLGIDFLRDLTTNQRLSPQAALDRFCLLALNMNEFLFLD